ncbi:MAG: LrgB family protein [Desulfuromonadaceae bacterium]|nr:LrgB family protein [Desulfuromonadaceae bacterium]
MSAELTASPLFGIGATLLIYELATLLYRRWPLALLNPVLVTIVGLIGLLQAVHIPYDSYRRGGDMILFLLGPAVVALGLPLYQRRQEVLARLVPILCGVSAGAVASIVSACGLVLLFGGGTELALSLAPKSVTTPIAIGIAQKTGGIPALTASVVVMTGCLGAIIGPEFCRLIGVRDPVSMGLAMGTASHGLGTGRMLEIHLLGGAIAGLAIGLNGIITALLVPLFDWLFF